MDKVNNVT